MVSRKNDKYIESKRGKLITLLIASFVLLLSVGYTALNEELTISGEASFRVEEDIRVTGINILQTTNSSIEDYNPTYGKDSIKIGVTLPSNQSTVTYKVKIANYSNVAMKIAKIEKLVTNNNYNITFNKALPLTIGKTSSEEIEITFKNNTNTSQTINANLLFAFAKLESMMTTGTNGGATSTFFRGPIAKNTVSSITFMPTKEVPEDAIGYWDCSYTIGKNEVIAYYLNSDTEGMYDLYIAADGEVYAPANSNNLFYNFNNVTNIDFNNMFNTEKVTTMFSMFASCASLTSLDVSKFAFLNNGINLTNMFNGCSSLTDIKVEGWNITNVTNMHQMFFGCSKLENLDVSNWNTNKVTSMYRMFEGCASLKALDVSNWQTPNLTSMERMFYNCASLKNLDLSKFNTLNVTNMGSMFYGCVALNTIEFGDDFDTTNVTSMSYMFQDCISLISLDVSKFNTSNVTDMTNMFRQCASLTSLDVSSFNTSNVTSMLGMFNICSSLLNLDLSNFNTQNVTSMSYMFQNCSSLTNLTVSNFDTSKVTTMLSMFKGCSSLLDLNLSNFDTSNVTNMNQMFYNCTKLKELDIRNMDFENKTVTTANIFVMVPSGINIYVLNEYNKTFIEGLKSNANVIIPEA